MGHFVQYIRAFVVAPLDSPLDRFEMDGAGRDCLGAFSQASTALLIFRDRRYHPYWS
jgi:hypothetical protein